MGNKHVNQIRINVINTVKNVTRSLKYKKDSIRNEVNELKN